MTLITDDSADTAQLPTNPADGTSTTDPAGDGMARLALLLAQALVRAPLFP